LALWVLALWVLALVLVLVLAPKLWH
jgi:uncharacterized protein YjeT (DUF2065 family)